MRQSARLRRGPSVPVGLPMTRSTLSGACKRRWREWSRQKSSTRTRFRCSQPLNIFFDALDSAIRANGGETLKFIGDGLLAIFPTPDDITAQTAAAMGALSSLDDARAALAGLSTQGSEITFRAALHVGDIHYGNIGSANRLDFTAVGPAVNLTARMLQACSEIGVATVCSDAFAPLTQGRQNRIERSRSKVFRSISWSILSSDTGRLEKNSAVCDRLRPFSDFHRLNRGGQS